MAYLLMIDDNPRNQRYIERIIRHRSPHQIAFAASASEGLESIVARRPDVLLLDLYFPGMDGIEFFTALRGHPNTRTIPVLFHSAVPLDAVSQMRLDKIHFEGFFEFPIEASALDALIATALRRNAVKVSQWTPPQA